MKSAGMYHIQVVASWYKYFSWLQTTSFTSIHRTRLSACVCSDSALQILLSFIYKRTGVTRFGCDPGFAEFFELGRECDFSFRLVEQIENYTLINLYSAFWTRLAPSENCLS
jgi:hypothetical protein